MPSFPFSLEVDLSPHTWPLPKRPRVSLGSGEELSRLQDKQAPGSPPWPPDPPLPLHNRKSFEKKGDPPPTYTLRPKRFESFLKESQAEGLAATGAPDPVNT